MVVLAFRVRTYARNIYLYGNTRFAEISEEYKIPVIQYAATNAEGVIVQASIDNALAQGWITQEEYDETMRYKIT